MTGRAPESSRALVPGGRVRRVEAGSPAAAAGIAPGDLITALDGRALRDTIDYRFYLEVGGGQLEVERGGRRFSVRVSCEGGDPGIVFESDIFDRVRVCRNKCPFCFVNQLPRGLRKPFYVKDDDFRLSFLYGNFVTLNNLEPEDLDRIIAQRLSPLHVSVHATDPAVRARLMGCDPELAARGLKNLHLL
ncbi:MAG: PDZ domain-containing protein, partial [Actinomycetota bacterium]